LGQTFWLFHRLLAIVSPPAGLPQAFIKEKDKTEAKNNGAKSVESTRVVTSDIPDHNSYQKVG